MTTRIIDENGKEIPLEEWEEFERNPPKITVSQLIEALKQFPEDATVVAYEGEGVGISIGYRDGRAGWIGSFLKWGGKLDIDLPS